MAAVDIEDASLAKSGKSSNKLDVEKQQGDVRERLPEALVELILEKLPFSSLFRFCCVCKRWRDLILSGHAILLTYFDRGQLIVRTSMRGVWEKVPLRFFDLEQPRLLHLVASAGGLLCFGTDVLGEYIVCNPLTQDYKKLPSMLSAGALQAENRARGNLVMSFSCYETQNLSKSDKFLNVGMIMSSDSKSFKLVVACMSYVSPKVMTGFRPGTTMVYDSQTGSWKKVNEIPQDHGICFRLKPVVCNGHLCCSLYSPSTRDMFLRGKKTGDMLLRYEVDQERWSLVSIPERLGIPCKLMDLDEKLVLMTVNHPCPGGFGFFELQDSGFTVWQSSNSLLLTKVREAMTAEFQEWSSSGFECFGDKNVLCFMGKCRNLRDPDSLCTRMWIHDIFRNSYTVSDWEEWQLGDDLLYDDCQLFKPSTVSCN